MAPPQPSPELMEELVEQVLLRFLPDDPASLVRAALVCKLWHRIVSTAAFRRRFQEFHRKAPLLGIFCDGPNAGHPLRGCRTGSPPTPPTAWFVPTSSFRMPRAAGHYGRRVIDARHGRVLLHHVPSENDGCCKVVDLSVWDPITNEHRQLPSLPLHLHMSMNLRSWNAAVVCAAAARGSCDHLDCHREPFLVVFMSITKHGEMFACIYASDDTANAWREVASTKLRYLYDYFESAPGVLLGNTLYFLVGDSFGIIKYDLATQEISGIHLLPEFRNQSNVLMTTEDGRLGLATMGLKYKLHLRSSMEVDSNGHAAFVFSRLIDLEKVLPDNARKASSIVSGFADGVGVLFAWTYDGLYSIDMKSEQVKKVPGCHAFDVVPYLSFHTPALGATSTGDEPTDQDLVLRSCKTL